MKKLLFTLSVTLAFVSTAVSQDSNFDRKYRFGLRVTPQPTWFASNEKSNVPSGAVFGVGFGLNIERRFSDVVSLLTGIGGDFEGGKYTFRSDQNTNQKTNFEPKYWLDENDELVKPTLENRTKQTNTAFVLKGRTVKTTYVSIPIILKLSTKEINGLKYSGLFGGELGVRIKATASDTYYEARKYTHDTDYVAVPSELSLSDINIDKDGALIPLRLSLSAGLGAEYRLSGSTAAFVNVNYVLGFTNQFKKDSEYIIYKTERGAENATPVKQNLKMVGIRISLGIMF